MNTFWSIDKHFLVKNLFKVSFFILLPKTFWLKNLLIWNLQNLPCLPSTEPSFAQVDQGGAGHTPPQQAVQGGPTLHTTCDQASKECWPD